MPEYDLTADQMAAVGDLLQRAESCQDSVIRFTRLASDSEAPRDECYADTQTTLDSVLGLPAVPATITEIHLEKVNGVPTGKLAVNQALS